MSLWSETSSAFSQERICKRVRDLSIGLLACTGRRTVTGMITAAGEAEHDWSSSYRVFDRRTWDLTSSFGVAVDHLRELSPVSDVVVTALDDTKVKKTGTKIPGVSYQRDPRSPPFHMNLIRAQRFVQLSWNVPFSCSPAVQARAFPVDFRHAPPPIKPRKGASTEQKTVYRKAAKEQNLSHVGVQILSAFRKQLDDHGAADRVHVTSVDGSYTNRTVLKNLPARTTLIGRIRKDAVLSYEPIDQPARGRRRLYGDPAPTPDQLRQDETVPWQTVQIFAAGRLQECQVKTVAPLLWRVAGPRALRLVVIRPLGYRRSSATRVLYRQPAYLICTDVDLPLQKLVQSYFWRWDIEVNHRDEKQLIGVGQAQVRSQRSVDRIPPFAVLSYTFMLIAAARVLGLAATRDVLPLPKWRRSTTPSTPVPPDPLPRLSSNQILSLFRQNLPSPSARSDSPNFTDFAAKIARHTKCSKSLISHAQALAFATR